MSSSIIRKDLSFSRKERYHEIGEQGEINVGKLLSSIYGHRIVSYGFDGYSEGTNGYPDLVLKLNPPLAIEVKSMYPYVIRNKKDGKKYKYQNWVPINKIQWENEKQFAKNKMAKLILIIEIRLKDKGIYFWFDSEQVEEYFDKSKSEYGYIPLYDVLEKGNSLIYDDEIKYLEYWNMNNPIDTNQIQIV